MIRMDGAGVVMFYVCMAIFFVSGVAIGALVW